MNPHCLVAMALALFVTLDRASAQTDVRAALNGEWVYVEDRTEGRALERLGPPMSTTFSLRSEEDAVILVRGHGSGHRDVRVALDGSITEVGDGKKTARYRGAWKDGAFTYEVDFVREPGSAPDGLIRRELRPTADGLVVTATSGSPASSASIAIYRHAEDIELPAPAKATIGDLEWLAGAWVGTRSSGSSIEERWSPPLGGAMLGTSRTVSRGRMSAFEFLRVVERDGGLVYVAQPGGATATEFVLTELTGSRAVFDNPRHSYPKRIVYERSSAGELCATIGFTKGGTPRRFEFKREGG
ncbi:MAG: hypothetical protein H6838_10670 [Planctomycetes bacterium]|nr:hypothetical protein [Planctomycetota bacterium]MCB9885949.1 hypothetical protein [Planctomycetota bacterium]